MLKWFFVSLALIVNVGSALHQLSRCQLVYQLRNQHFPEPQLRDWVCLVEHESNRFVDLVSAVQPDGSRGYGLFQINDRLQCSKSSKPGNLCGATCAAMLTNDITQSALCAKKIHRLGSFFSWTGWTRNCLNKPLPDISRC